MTTLLLFALLHGQDDTELKEKEETVRKRLAELFEICKGEDLSKAAGYVVYRGVDKDRKWKDPCDYKNEDEKKAVDRICERIKGYFKDYESHEIVKFHAEKESEGEWCILEVTFKKAEKTKKVAFCFLKVKDAYAIGDID